MTYSSTAFQFTHLLQRVYDKLEQTKGLVATSGSSTSIVEDTLLSSDFQDDDLNGSTVFVQYDVGGAGAAPEGEYRNVTDFVSSTKQLTVSPVFSAAVATGDYISLARGSIFPLNDVKRMCNNALKILGDVVNVDTSLTTASSQTEYTVPSGVLYSRIIDVRYQRNTGDSDDNEYASIPFKVIPDASIGGADAVIEIEQLDSGRTLQIISVSPHTTLVDYDDPISLDIHPALAVIACAVECSTINRSYSEQVGLTQKLQQEYAIEIIRHPVRKYNRQIHGMPHWTHDFGYPGDQSIYDR